MTSETTATFPASFSIWDRSRNREYFRGIKLSNFVSIGAVESGLNCKGHVASKPCDGQLADELTVAQTMSCSSCNSRFKSREEQVLHFKSDVHCENLKRRERGLSPIKNFSASDDDDDSNDEDSADSDPSSSSEDEVDSEIPLSGPGSNHQRQPKIFYENANGDLFSMYKCLLLSQKEDALTAEVLMERTKKLPDVSKWAILLLSQGHFAGAIFKQNDVLLRKTFHRYVVRAKQGSSQSVHDNHSKHAKSAGANLRRHNETALIHEIQTLLRAWSEELADCSHIFYRAPGSQKYVLFGGKSSLFDKNDLRLRNIPFPTKRPKHIEIVRVKDKLATVELYGKSSNWQDHVLLPNKKPTENVLILSKNDFDSAHKEVKSPKVTNKDCKSSSTNTSVPENAKESTENSRNKKTRQVTPQISRNPSSEEDDDDSLILCCQEECHSTADLKLFAGTKPPKSGKPKSKQKSSNATTRAKSFLDEDGKKLHNALFTACKINHVENVEKLLSSFTKVDGSELSSREPEINSSNIQNRMSREQILLQVLNFPFGSSRSTLLHTVSRCGYTVLLRLLLAKGADPTIKDNANLTAYCVAVNKQTRNTFRRFMAEFPEKYDYSLAQIPSALSEDAEKAKASKLQEKRQAKRQKSKLIKTEEENKQNFLKLSDAEKKTTMTNLRCFFCADSLTGKVPFEYSDMKFCTMTCLKQHKQRRQS